MTNLRNLTKPAVGSAVTLAQHTEPGWAVIDGDVGGHGYNETKVDIIAVPCPGAEPLHPWTCDPVAESDFGGGHGGGGLGSSGADKPGTPKSMNRPPYVWIQQGIRNKDPSIRVLVYKHRSLREGINIDMLATDLLDQVLQIRQGVVRLLIPLHILLPKPPKTPKTPGNETHVVFCCLFFVLESSKN